MKKLFFCLVIAVLFIALFFMPMAWSMDYGRPTDEVDIAQLQKMAKSALYKEDISLSAPDRMLFLVQPEGSPARRLFDQVMALRAQLPSCAALTWSERLYYEHEAHATGREKAIAQLQKR